jgi:hypothetical protein
MGPWSNSCMEMKLQSTPGRASLLTSQFLKRSRLDILLSVCAVLLLVCFLPIELRQGVVAAILASRVVCALFLSDGAVSRRVHARDVLVDAQGSCITGLLIVTSLGGTSPLSVMLISRRSCWATCGA